MASYRGKFILCNKDCDQKDKYIRQYILVLRNVDFFYKNQCLLHNMYNIVNETNLHITKTKKPQF